MMFVCLYKSTHSGVWNVPFISTAILFKGEWLQKNSNDLPQYHSEVYDPDMALCDWMRNKVRAIIVAILIL